MTRLLTAAGVVSSRVLKTLKPRPARAAVAPAIAASHGPTGLRRLIHLLHGFGDLLTQPLMRGIAVRTLVPEHGHLVTWHFQRRLDHL